MQIPTLLFLTYYLNMPKNNSNTLNVSSIYHATLLVIRILQNKFSNQFTYLFLNIKKTILKETS